MPKYIRLEPHLSTDELGARYQAAQRPIERTRWHAVWLLSQGRSSTEVARSPGARRSRCGAWSSATTKERGRRRRYAAAQPRPCSPADGENWNGPKVALRMPKCSATPCVRSGAGRRFAAPAIRPNGRARATRKPTPKLKTAFKQALPQSFEQAQKQGQLPVELWSMDEHRVGLDRSCARREQSGAGARSR